MNRQARTKEVGMAIAVIILAGLPAAWAANPTLGATGQWSVASGKVTMVDPAASTLKIQTGLLQKTFIVDAKTEISDGQRDLKLQDLKPGTEVMIQYNEEGGKLVSRSITLASAEAPKAAQTSTPTGSAPGQFTPNRPSAPAGSGSVQPEANRPATQ